MADITLEDLLGKKEGTKGDDIDILTMIDEALNRIESIAMKAIKLKNNPIVQEYINERGRRLEEIGLFPRGFFAAKASGNAYRGNPDIIETEAKVKKNESEEGSMNAEKLFNAIDGALDTVKAVKGNITIEELQEFLHQNKEMVIKVLQEHEAEFTE